MELAALGHLKSPYRFIIALRSAIIALRATCLYVSCSGSITSVRELICLPRLLVFCIYLGYFRKGFLFLLVLGRAEFFILRLPKPSI